MTAEKNETASDKWRAVFDRAQTRSVKSRSKAEYMYAFEDTLRALRRDGEQALLERRQKWQDPVQQAAEIEALSAFRAMEHWGTSWGLYDPKRGFYRRAA